MQLNDFVNEMKIKDINTHSLNFRYAKNLVDQHTVLIGNIAHNIHPVAGQGLNLSIKDIALLVKTLLKYQSLGYLINDPIVLQEFNQKRKLDNMAYSFGTLTLESFLRNQNKSLDLVRKNGFKMFKKNNLLKNLFVRSATGKDFFKFL